VKPVPALLLALTVAVVPAQAKGKRTSATVPPVDTSSQAPPPPEPQPYRSRVARLAEILGALAYLDELCGKGDGDRWRASMKALIEAQGRTDLDKEILAGAFNQGYGGYRVSYRSCTANARIAIFRFLSEGRRIAHDVVDRYGSS
jgi:uncharacterized protein (TIGR02301 family)